MTTTKQKKLRYCTNTKKKLRKLGNLTEKITANLSLRLKTITYNYIKQAEGKKQLLKNV